jgi:hypothetical protein
MDFYAANFSVRAQAAMNGRNKSGPRTHILGYFRSSLRDFSLLVKHNPGLASWATLGPSLRDFLLSLEHNPRLAPTLGQSCPN